jgi:uncharacterized GH25 family protein
VATELCVRINAMKKYIIIGVVLICLISIIPISVHVGNVMSVRVEWENGNPINNAKVDRLYNLKLYGNSFQTETKYTDRSGCKYLK